jgi:alanine racemase
MMMLFQNWDFLCIEDLDLHNLAAKRASSSLAYVVAVFLSNYLQLYYITAALKSKSYSFIINMSSGFNRNGCSPRMVDSGTMVWYVWLVEVLLQL